AAGASGPCTTCASSSTGPPGRVPPAPARGPRASPSRRSPQGTAPRGAPCHDPGPMAVLLALCAAASWGLADFPAGLSSRRVSVPIVLLLVEGGGLVVVLAITLISGEPFFAQTSDALSAVAGGISGV